MSDLIVPSNIPWQELKGELLEEFVYWLMDELGAKDLEWRKGGAKTTSADGGRDLEATFYVPGPDGEINPQRWWLEVKGRSKTVEPSAVEQAVVGVANRPDLECMVIVTNSQFSNRSRDWVNQWQTQHPRPKIRLWDRADLERMVSKHPSVIVRFAPEALSLAGRLDVLRSRFWNQSYFPGAEDLESLWDKSNELGWSAESLLTIVAGEVVNGDVRERPWLGTIDSRGLAQVVGLMMVNLASLGYRAERFGVNFERIVEVAAYIVAIGIARLHSDVVEPLVEDPWKLTGVPDFPQEAREMLRDGVIERIRREFLDACSRDCERVGGDTAFQPFIQIDETYWHRFSEASTFVEKPTRRLLTQRYDAACKVGFPADRDNGCPLMELPKRSATELVSVFRKVIEARIVRKSETSQ